MKFVARADVLQEGLVLCVHFTASSLMIDV